MTYTGHVRNGVVVLDEPVRLQEGAQVRVEVLGEANREPLHPEIERFTGVLPPGVDIAAEYAKGVSKSHR